MTEDYDETTSSKTARKKAMTALQKVGETLVKMNAQQLAIIPLDDTLRAAITQAQAMRTGSALRRQLQYIGKLMRSTDHEAISEALKHLEDTDKRQTHLFHQTENWRDRFIEEGQPALNDFLEQYPHSDRQQLRQLLREAIKEQQQLSINPGLSPKYSRKLFKVLRDILAAP